MSFRKIQTTNLDSTQTTFADPVIIIGDQNTSATDIGILGKIGTNTYAGIVRDSLTSEFLLIDSYTQSATNNDIVAGSATLGHLSLDGITIDTKIVLPKGTTAQRPSSPEEGQLWFNTETKMFEGYDGTSWQVLIPSQLQNS
jgi:hypothetical protein